ncbi:MAG: acetyltransferase-like isoleucine patch superfamily enzyme [Flavobacteriales bacterium]|jgi:acetyltransferase-like isoleucine patch superfamily enzyme
MQKFLTVVSILFFPNIITQFLLNMLGHKIHAKSYIGFSLVPSRKIYMDAGARIGHFNIVQVDKILMRENSFIKKMNRIRGAMNVIMGPESAIANSNSIFRAPSPITYGNGTLKLGRLALIVTKHNLDCTRSITIGDYTTIGGIRSQFWTHGYFHGSKGKERIRIDGEIVVSSNVYVGTGCIFNPGVEIAENINIGGGACISKSLQRPGMYVAQPLRYIEKEIGSIRSALDKIKEKPLVEEVYEKKNSPRKAEKIEAYEQATP